MNNQDNKTNGGVAVLEQPVQKVLSVIAWGKKHNKQPQQIYGWLREGKVPETCIYHDPVTGRQLLIEEPMDAWYETRSNQRAANPNRKHLTKPTHILASMIGWFEAAGQKQLADDLQPILNTLVEEEVREEAEAKAAADAAVNTEPVVAVDAEPTKADEDTKA